MGASAIGVVRMSGPGAIATADAIVRGRERLADATSHVVRRITLIDPARGDTVDDALAVVMRAPRSYTGEDIVELSCHGSPAVLARVVQMLVDHGARLAEPGEFTRRAYVNGRMDLARAEAVALLIGARTERAAALAARAVAGELANRVAALRDRLLDLVAGLEVALDFPDEQVGLSAADTAAELRALERDAEALVAAAERGRVVHEGVKVALIGAPNAGKSTLFNALLGVDRAIVSAIPGTTRDVIHGTIELSGVPVTLLDTAGLGVPGDPIEAEGIRRSMKAADEADALLIVIDGTVELDPEVLDATRYRPRLIVLTKSDLPSHPSVRQVDEAVVVSAATGDGIEGVLDGLERYIAQCVTGDLEEGALVASLRQLGDLRALLAAVERSRSAIGVSACEAVLVDLREALAVATEFFGGDVGDAVLERIFSTFCLGK